MKKILIIVLILSFQLTAQFWEEFGNGWNRNVSFATQISLNDELYVLGGFSRSEQTNSDLISKFTNTIAMFDIVDTMLSARAGLAGFAYQDTLFYYGGLSDTSSNTNNLMYYVPTTGDIGVKDNDPLFSRFYSSCEIVGNNLYIIGGNSVTSVDSVNLHYIVKYNMDTKEIVPIENKNVFSDNYLPEHQLSLVSGKYIFLLGGDFLGQYDVILKYDIEQDTLSDPLSVSLPIARMGGNIVAMGSNKYLLIGGYKSSSELNRRCTLLEVTDGEIVSMTEGYPIKFPRKFSVAGSYDGKAYLFGGMTHSLAAISEVEVFDYFSIVPVEEEISPIDFQLTQNYPNPFNPATTIGFNLHKQEYITLSLYDVTGSLVKTLEKGYFNKGFHSVKIGNETTGNLSSGIYFYTLISGSGLQSKKMVLLK